MKDTQKSATSTTFTDEERVAMKERVKEQEAAARRDADKADGESDVLAKDRRDVGTGSRDGRAALCDHQSQRASPLAETACRRMTLGRPT
jgi:hypothetical protein